MKRNRVCALLGLAALVACGEQGTEGLVPQNIELASLDPISAEVGETIDLSVRVTSTRGDGAPGIPVRWTAGAASGTLESAASTTDASGVATVRWTLGSTAAEQTVVASVEGLQPLTIRVTPAAAAAVSLAIAVDSVRRFAVGD